MRFRGWVWALGGAALAALVMADWGCSKKGVTAPDAGPIGVVDVSRSRLVVWADSSSMPGTGRTLVVHLGVFDRTPANCYRLWRQEPSGGYRLVKDFSAAATTKFISQDTEYFRFFDLPTPPLPDTVRYLVQGGFSGSYGTFSPLSNTAALHKTLPPPDTNLVVICPKDSAATDSMPKITLEQVSGAAGYVLQIYKPRHDVKDTDIFPESDPQVFYEKSRNFLLAYLPADPALPAGSRVIFQVGDNVVGPSRLPITVYESRLPMLASDLYRWRLAAVTKEGRIRSVCAGFRRPYIAENELRYIISGFNVYFASRTCSAVPPPIECKCQ